MKTILLVCIGIVAAIAPVHAASKSFKVTDVVIVSLTNKIPPGAPVFKKGATVKLNISKKRVTGQKGISIPLIRGSATEDIYTKIIARQGKSDTATVSKFGGKITGVNLNFTRKIASPIPGVTMPGQVTYILEPK
jgi:hypothetical protein